MLYSSVKDPFYLPAHVSVLITIYVQENRPHIIILYISTQNYVIDTSGVELSIILEIGWDTCIGTKRLYIIVSLVYYRRIIIGLCRSKYVYSVKHTYGTIIQYCNHIIIGANLGLIFLGAIIWLYHTQTRRWELCQHTSYLIDLQTFKITNIMIKEKMYTYYSYDFQRMFSIIIIKLSSMKIVYLCYFVIFLYI